MKLRLKWCYPILSVFFLDTGLIAQPFSTIELKKPPAFEDRKLTAEKTGDKKFSTAKRIYNNLVTHYNYYYNANDRLNGILERAKKTHTDDYTQLLSFYNYSLDVTAKDEIDTVLYKCTAGILLHDLRSDWVDNLYLLLGKAYFYRKDFDSAAHVFQYINYAFAPKDDGYDIPIGSNSSNPNGIFTVSTNEKRNLWKTITTSNPSRNESFIWQVRNYLEKQQLAEAAGLIEILRSDPFFPRRLQDQLHEVTAYLFYQQKYYDSAAFHLTKSLSQTENKAEQSRWEYLAAQLYQLAKRPDDAVKWYEAAIKHAIDPYMEVYARLQMAALSFGGQTNAAQENINALLKMARRDKYESYRDIIYYAAAQIEMSRLNYDNAAKLLTKSVAAGSNNLPQQQHSLLALADIAYLQKKYATAYKFYDSIDIATLSPSEKANIQTRKPALQVIANNELRMQQQDSLLAIAALPEAERTAVIKKVLKQLRKEKGLKDNDAKNNTDTDNDLFGTGNSTFYFLSNNAKSKGFADFKNKWGVRPNIDNWRRQSAIDRNLNTVSTPQLVLQKDAVQQKEVPTFDALLQSIPLDTIQSANSKKILITSMMDNAAVFQYQLRDFPSAIDMYQQVLSRFPDMPESEKAMFNLVQLYQKTHIKKSDSLQQVFTKKFPESVLPDILTKQQTNTDPATTVYKNIYNMFIEGRFKAAIEAKAIADSQIGKSYWTPQLLYIEAIYHIKQQEDSTAIVRLTQLQDLFAQSPMAEKAKTMIDVLKRKPEIEDYLTNMIISKRDEIVIRKLYADSAYTITTPETPKDSSLVQNGQKQINPTTPLILNPVKKDSSVVTADQFEFDPSDTHYVILILNKVDPVFIGEARNAFNRFNQERYYNQPIPISTHPLNADIQVMLMGPFPNAAEAVIYTEKTKPITASRILPWLPAEKYSFSILSSRNLTILDKQKDIEAYKAFLQKALPDKF